MTFVESNIETVTSIKLYHYLYCIKYKYSIVSKDFDQDYEDITPFRMKHRDFKLLSTKYHDLTLL